MTREQAEARFFLENNLLFESFGLKEPVLYEGYPPEYTCWVCDAIKPTADSGCSCDRGYTHFGPDQ